jgi:hypothetical protein
MFMVNACDRNRFKYVGQSLPVRQPWIEVKYFSEPYNIMTVVTD